MSEEEMRGVLNVALSILNGHVIMRGDVVTSPGHPVRVGNNPTIVLESDTANGLASSTALLAR